MTDLTRGAQLRVSDLDHSMMDEALFTRVRTREVHFTVGRLLVDVHGEVDVAVARDLVHQRDNHTNSLLVHHFPEVAERGLDGPLS